ncbi:MAG: hypothetical protein V9H69_24730 [Anaerolineae bacterium]
MAHLAKARFNGRRDVAGEFIPRRDRISAMFAAGRYSLPGDVRRHAMFVAGRCPPGDKSPGYKAAPRERGLAHLAKARFNGRRDVAGEFIPRRDRISAMFAAGRYSSPCDVRRAINRPATKQRPVNGAWRIWRKPVSTGAAM